MFLDSLFASGTPSFFVLLWKGFAPPKIDVFIWLLLNGSTLSNRVFLAGGGIVNYEDALFPFYCEEIGLVIIYFITVLLRGIFRVDSCIGSGVYVVYLGILNKIFKNGTCR